MHMRYIFLIILLSTVMGLSAQDIHFSQFTASPMTTNPALTGVFNGDYRVVANYRNQWKSVIVNPYKTMAGSVDMSLVKGIIGNDFIGVGVQVFTDKAGASDFGMVHMSFLSSYNFAITREGNQFLSIGAKIGYAQRSFNTNNLQFGSQYDGQNFNPGLSSGESFGQDNFSFADFSTGVLWYYFADKGFNIYVGGAVSHLNRPKRSFLALVDERLYAKATIHAGSELYISEDIALLPSVLYLRQGPSQEIDLGSFVKFDFNSSGPGTAFYLGLWGRVAKPTVDAIYLVSRFDYKNASIGLSYDVNISGLQAASNYRGGPEVSLTYIGSLGSGDKPKTNKKIICPRF